MRRFGFKFLIIVLTLVFIAGCKSSKHPKKTYAKHRPTSTKKTHHASHSKNSTHKKTTTPNSHTKPDDPDNNTNTSGSTSPKAEKVINTARSYLGTKYQYGGTTKGGMDCSGLICTSYKSVGVNLPRRSEEQSSFGKRIYIGELQPGDLVFFATGGSKTKITHVGMVTQVKSPTEVLFIHSSSSRGVVEDNIHDAYYRERYIKAVRPL